MNWLEVALTWEPQWDDREDGLSGLSESALAAISDAINGRNYYSEALRELQKRSRLPLGVIAYRGETRVPGLGLLAARTPEEALAFADNELREADAQDARLSYDIGICHNLSDTAKGHIRDIERSIDNNELSSNYNQLLTSSAVYSFSSGTKEAPLNLAKAQKKAQALIQLRGKKAQAAPSVPAKTVRRLQNVNGVYRYVDAPVSPAPTYNSRLAEGIPTMPDPSQVVFDTMRRSGEGLAINLLGSLGSSDAIRAARMIELLRATKEYEHGLGGDQAMSGFAEGVLSVDSPHVRAMALELGNTLLRDGAPVLWMRHANSNPNEIHTQDSKPVGLEVFSEPGGSYIAAHDSNKRTEYGHLVDGRPRDKIVRLADKRDLEGYIEWLGNRGWFTNYIDPLSDVSSVRQFSPVGGDFIAWEERAKERVS